VVGVGQYERLLLSVRNLASHDRIGDIALLPVRLCASRGALSDSPHEQQGGGTMS